MLVAGLINNSAAVERALSALCAGERATIKALRPMMFSVQIRFERRRSGKAAISRMSTVSETPLLEYLVSSTLSTHCTAAGAPSPTFFFGSASINNTFTPSLRYQNLIHAVEHGVDERGRAELYAGLSEAKQEANRLRDELKEVSTSLTLAPWLSNNCPSPTSYNVPP